MARKMRDSGVEWIGEVPEGWEVNRLQWHLEELVEKNDPIQTTNILSLTNDRGVIPYEDKGNVGNKAKENYTEYKLAYKNTIVANSMNVLIGSVGLSKYDGCVSPVYYIYKSKDSNSIRYYNYLFQLTPFQKELRRYANGILEIRLRVSSSDILKRSVPAPSFSEQRRIADYLDEKCAAIDGAVGELKRGIEDCKAWKKAIIFEAVTGKANVLAAKNAKVAKRQMRDSGIPWIGEIPEGWEVKPLRRLGRLANGISKGGEYFGKGFPFVSYSDVYKNDAIPTQVKGLVEANDQERERYSVKRGDVFFTRTSETVDEIGIAAACLKDIQDSTFAGFLIRFRPMTDELLPEFSKYYFRNKLVSEYFAKELVMVTRASLGQELLKSLPVFIPPMKEQQAIADYLDEKCAAIDALVAEKEKLIADLEAYKKSLIYETVTGKREVA